MCVCITYRSEKDMHVISNVLWSCSQEADAALEAGAARPAAAPLMLKAMLQNVHGKVSCLHIQARTYMLFGHDACGARNATDVWAVCVYLNPAASEHLNVPAACLRSITLDRISVTDHCYIFLLRLCACASL
jgi:hypothetical protein